jgi:lysophospholipase L1-like esterase
VLALGGKNRRKLIQNTHTGLFRRKFQLTGEDEKKKISKKIQETVIRNVASMIGTIKSHNPDALIFLSSFYHSGDSTDIRDLNFAFRRYANVSGIIFVDAAGKMPRKESMTYDYGHFTKEGDQQMAKIFSEAIINELNL